MAKRFGLIAAFDAAKGLGLEVDHGGISWRWPIKARMHWRGVALFDPAEVAAMRAARSA